jgi:hypothetical protein
MSRQKHLQLIHEIVSEFSSDHVIEPTKNCHIAVTLRLGDRTRKVFGPSTPSDHRWQKNFRSNVRNAARELVTQATLH